MQAGSDEARTLSIDIDGVLAQARADLDYARCEPVPGAVAALRRLREEGWVLVLHTGRHFNRLRETVDWLRRHGFVYDHLVLGKPVARFYIDDRGIAFEGSWGPIVERLGKAPAPAVEVA